MLHPKMREATGEPTARLFIFTNLLRKCGKTSVTTANFLYMGDAVLFRLQGELGALRPTMLVKTARSVNTYFRPSFKASLAALNDWPGPFRKPAS
jgi:hypothetical protein